MPRHNLVDKAYYWVMMSHDWVIALYKGDYWYLPGNENGYGFIHVEKVGPRIPQYGRKKVKRFIVCCPCPSQDAPNFIRYYRNKNGEIVNHGICRCKCHK